MVWDEMWPYHVIPIITRMYVKLGYTYTAMKLIWTPYILWSDVRKSNRIKSNIESF